MRTALRFLWPLVATVGATAALVIVATTQTTTGIGNSTRPVPPFFLARPAPDFRLRTFQDRWLALSDFRGDIILLNFWASWCTPCKQEMPNLERAWQEYKHRGVVVLGINVADDMEDAAEFVRALRITYPNVYDRDRSRLDAYQVIALPTTVFIDRRQHIRGRFVGGYLDEAGYQELRANVLALLDSSP